MVGIIPATMVSPSTDLDLTQAQAFALTPGDLAELLGTVVDSLSHTLTCLRPPTDLSQLHRTLHDLKGYLGLVASPGLCHSIQQADHWARQGDMSEALTIMRPVIPRLQGLLEDLRSHRAGIIDA
jgi:hypothetical protein